MQENNEQTVEMTDDLRQIKQLIDELIQKVNASPKKSRYRSLVVTHLEIAEGFLLKEEKTQ